MRSGTGEGVSGGENMAERAVGTTFVNINWARFVRGRARETTPPALFPGSAQICGRPGKKERTCPESERSAVPSEGLLNADAVFVYFIFLFSFEEGSVPRGAHARRDYSEACRVTWSLMNA